MSARIDLAELERKAIEASRSSLNAVRWFSVDERTVAWSPTIDGRDTCVPQSYADTFDDRDTAYIAAACPPVVLALIARIRELEDVAACAVDAAGAESGRSNFDEIDAWRAVLEKGAVLP